MGDSSPLEDEVNILDLPEDLFSPLLDIVSSAQTPDQQFLLAKRIVHGHAFREQHVDPLVLRHDLQKAVQQGNGCRLPLSAVPFLRRLQWARLLGVCEGNTPDEWAENVKRQRDIYHQLRREQQLYAAKLSGLDPKRFHPLAETADNPWTRLQEDVELQEEIWRDVKRTFPERTLFVQESTQQALHRVLFAWSKSNPDISYKQGMNELLAVLYLVCAREVVPQKSKCGNVLDVIFSSDLNDIEADAFRLFDSIMTRHYMRTMFLPPPQKASPPAPVVAASCSPLHVLQSGGVGGASSRGPMPQSAIILRCRRIFDSLLARTDPELYSHLKHLGVEPQLFLLRWLRLIFSREFHIEDTLLIWDAVFCDAWLTERDDSVVVSAVDGSHQTCSSTSSVDGQAKALGTVGNVDSGSSNHASLSATASERLPLVDYFAIAMLEFIREHLLESDYNGCLRRLLKFPPIESVQCLVALSLSIREKGSLCLYKKGQLQSQLSKDDSRCCMLDPTDQAAPIGQEPSRRCLPVVASTPQHEGNTFESRRSTLCTQGKRTADGHLECRDSTARSFSDKLEALCKHIGCMREALRSALSEASNEATTRDVVNMVVSDLSTLQSVLEGRMQYSDGLFQLSDCGASAHSSVQDATQTMPQNPAKRSEVGSWGSNEAFWNDFLPEVSGSNYAAAAAAQCVRAVEGTIDVLSHITASASKVSGVSAARPISTSSSVSHVVGSPTIVLRNSSRDACTSTQENVRG